MHQQYNNLSQSPLALLHWLCKETLRGQKNFNFNTENEICYLNGEEMSTKLDEMVAVAQGSTLQNTLPDGDLRLYVQQMQLYAFLISPNGIKEQRSELQDWVATKNNGSFGIIYQISTAIAAMDISTAQNLLNSWNRTNRVDDNYATYLAWKIQQMQGLSINMNDIEDMCLKCPLTDGSVVIAAQCLYNSLTNAHRLFDNSCGIDDGRGAKSVVVKPQTTNNVVSVYPNPASYYINVLVADMQQAAITDIAGNTLQVAKARGDVITFNTKNLLPGLYFVKITYNKGNVKTEKFVKE